MRANTRLVWSIIMIIGSGLYGLMVVQAPRLAETVAVGYIALLLTIITATSVWKGP